MGHLQTHVYRLCRPPPQVSCAYPAPDDALDGSSLSRAGLCYLSVSSAPAASFVGISFDSTTDGIGSIETPAIQHRVTKYIDHGRIVISKDGRKYNLNGQTLK